MLPTDLRWTTSRPLPLRHPLRPVPRWITWVPDWVRYVVPWRWLDWFDSRYGTCWVKVVGWKLNGNTTETDLAIDRLCHTDARQCGRCYCNKIETGTQG